MSEHTEGERMIGTIGSNRTKTMTKTTTEKETETAK